MESMSGVDAAYLLKSPQSYAPFLRNEIEADAGENPVFIDEGRNITDGSQGDKIQIILQIWIFAFCPEPRFPQLSPQADDEIEGDSHSGEVLEGKRTVPTMGIDDRHGGGQFFRNLMMVENDGVDAQRRGVADILEVGNAAIHSDDQIDAALLEIVYGIAIQPVTFLDTIGNVIFDPRRQFPEKLDEHRHGGDAVGVVIAEDNDLFLSVDRLDNPVYGLAHIPKQERIVEIFQGRGEIAPGIIAVDDVPAHQNLGDYRQNAQFRRQTGGKFFLLACETPSRYR